MKNTIKTLAVLSMALLGTGAVVTNAQAKSHKSTHYRSVKVLKTHKTALRHVKVVNTNSHAFLYTSTSLKTKVDYVHNYAGQKGVTTYNVKLRLKSGKVATYTRVRNINGIGRGVYMRSSYLKTIKASTSKKTPATPAKKTPAKNDSKSDNTDTKPENSNVQTLGYHATIKNGDMLDYQVGNDQFVSASDYSSAKFQDEMLYEINALRESKGLSTLTTNSFLTAVADKRAEQQIANVENTGQVSHYTSDGKLGMDVVANELKNSQGNDYVAPMSENLAGIAISTDDEQGAINSYDAANQEFQQLVYDDEGFNNGHQKNILNVNSHQIGIGFAIDPATGQTTCAMEFDGGM